MVFGGKKKSSSLSKAESHNHFFPKGAEETLTLEGLQVRAESYVYFVLNIFLKPQEGIRFYTFSQILTSLKGDKSISVSYGLFSRGFLFAFITTLVSVFRIF